ncbi:hypothetical protein ACJX0J_018505 [Zea mays]
MAHMWAHFSIHLTKKEDIHTLQLLFSPISSLVLEVGLLLYLIYYSFFTLHYTSYNILLLYLYAILEYGAGNATMVYFVRLSLHHEPAAASTSCNMIPIAAARPVEKLETINNKELTTLWLN